MEAREHPDAPLAWATVLEDIPVRAATGRVKWHNSAYPDVTLPIAQILTGAGRAPLVALSAVPSSSPAALSARVRREYMTRM